VAGPTSARIETEEERAFFQRRLAVVFGAMSLLFALLFPAALLVYAFA